MISIVSSSSGSVVWTGFDCTYYQSCLRFIPEQILSNENRGLESPSGFLPFWLLATQHEHLSAWLPLASHSSFLHDTSAALSLSVAARGWMKRLGNQREPRSEPLRRHCSKLWRGFSELVAWRENSLESFPFFFWLALWIFPECNSQTFIETKWYIIWVKYKLIYSKYQFLFL